MKRVTIYLLSLLMVIGAIALSPQRTDEASAAGCWGSINYFRYAGYGVEAGASAACSGTTGRAYLCIHRGSASSCSSSIAIGYNSKSLYVYRGMVCLVGGSTTYAHAILYINGRAYTSRSLQVC